MLLTCPIGIVMSGILIFVALFLILVGADYQSAGYPYTTGHENLRAWCYPTHDEVS